MLELKQNTLQLPILDISQPLLPSTISSISQACEEWGYFHISNHGISKDLLGRLQTSVNSVFNLPLDIKLKAGPLSSINTYTPHFIASPFFESLKVSGPDYFNSAKNSSDALFSQPNDEFCDVLQEYGSRMMELCREIVLILLKCLGKGLETKHYESEFSKCHGYLRINKYTPPNDVEEHEVEGLGMHTDMSCITILHQDEIGGLQARTGEGDWVDIMPSEGTLVVNVGDLMQAWSNGRMRSSAHRVMLTKPVTRLSQAFFWCFEDEKVISAPDEVVGDGNERIYRPFVCQEYMKYRESIEPGKFDAVSYTVDGFAAIKVDV
ncbi:gibberellin 20-oxidase-like protein [Typha angustifolia]|uniref:gibberellin 20-oxidase-like protein n=1 Tax=Typha angustifolia TaxID=59011 RepID=UPI003C2B4D19